MKASFIGIIVFIQTGSRTLHVMSENTATSFISHHLRDVFIACIVLLMPPAEWKGSFSKLLLDLVAFYCSTSCHHGCCSVSVSVLGLSLGLYYTMNPIKALELAFSLIFRGRLFRFHGYLAPISSAMCKSETEDVLKINSSALTLLSIQALLYICFIIQRETLNQFTDSTYFCILFEAGHFLLLLWYLFFFTQHFAVTHNQCQRSWWNEARLYRRLSSLRRHRGVPLWGKLRPKPSIWSFSSRRKLAWLQASSLFKPPLIRWRQNKHILSTSTLLMTMNKYSFYHIVSHPLCRCCTLTGLLWSWFCWQ